MSLEDYKKAIDILLSAIGEEYSCYFVSISASLFGDRFIFNIDSETRYVVSVETGHITKECTDTWRNPKHREIICKGNNE